MGLIQRAGSPLRESSGHLEEPGRAHSAADAHGDDDVLHAAASREEAQKGLRDPITTEIAPAGPFRIAEAYHQQWDERHGSLSCPLSHRARRN